VGEGGGDGLDALAGEEVGEDPLHDRGIVRVRLEHMEPAAVSGLGEIGVRARVGEAVAVGWPAALVLAVDGDLGVHGGADPGLDVVALALPHAAVEVHDQVVGVRARPRR
jgi:hypothetical protein